MITRLPVATPFGNRCVLSTPSRCKRPCDRGRRRKTPKGGTGTASFWRWCSGVLQALAAQIREQVAAYCESTNVPGYVAGVYHDGAQLSLPMASKRRHGCADG